MGEVSNRNQQVSTYADLVVKVHSMVVVVVEALASGYELVIEDDA